MRKKKKGISLLIDEKHLTGLAHDNKPGPDPDFKTLKGQCETKLRDLEK